jgi:catechol 2,3-dioxygenase
MTSREPLFDIAHLGAVELLTPNLEASLGYFRDVLGMTVVNAQAGAIHLRCYGDYAASTLKLTEAKEAGVGCVAWRASSPEALRRRVETLEAAGCGEGWSNGDFGRGRAYRFHDPSGHRMEVYFEETP